MANTVIQLKKSSTPAAIPTELEFGEIALNYADGKLFYKNTTNQIAEISGAGGEGDLGDYFGTINANGVLVIADVPGDVLTFESGENITIVGDAINDKITISATANITPAFDVANTALTTGQAAFDKANAANLLAFNTGIGANAYTRIFANSVGTSSNAYSRVFANSVGTSANAYSDATFVKLVDGNQTITGDIGITGNLNVLGNVTTIGVENLVINDPVILLANNNNTDISDLGFVAHYANATSAQVHTGLIRDPGTKQWYLFKEYNDHFFYSGGNVDLSGNNFTIDTLNANIITNNLTLNGANASLSIGAAFDKANAANLLAFNTGIGANAYTRTFANTKLANTTGTFAGSLTISNDLITQGDVGIGTTSPTSNLHVIGTANITSALTAASIELGHPSDTTLARSSAGNVTIEGNIIYRAGGTDVPVTDGGTGASDAATARTNLGVGVGDSPYFAGVSANGANATNRIFWIRTNGSSRWAIVGSDTTETGSNTGTNLFINRYGDTGTYISTPFIINRQTGVTTLSQLSLVTDLAVADGGTGASDAATARTNLGLAIGTNVQAYNAGLAAIAGLGVTDGNFIVGNGTTWVAENADTARTSLGLGTTNSPTFAGLTVTGTSTGYTRLVAGTATNPGFLEWRLPDTTRVGYHGWNSGNTIVWQTENSWGIEISSATFSKFRTAGSERMRIDAAGNVGIGITSPTSLLHVDGTANVTFITVGSRIYQRNPGGTDFEIGPGSGTGNTQIWGFYAPASRAISLFTNTAERMHISSSGDVGIGTSSPTQKLHVVGNILSSGSIDCGTQFLGLATDTAAAPSFSFTGDTNTGMFRPGADTIAFATNGAEEMRIDASGNVGIGITSPTSLLHVNGTLRALSFGVGTAPSGTTGEIRATNNITAYYSDKRLKNILRTIPNAIEKIKRLSGVIFKNNDVAEKYGYTDTKEQVGVIAQEVEDVLPQIVVPAPFDIGQGDDGKEYSISGENYMTVYYDRLVPLLIEAIKEQQQQIEELKDILIKSGINKV